MNGVFVARVDLQGKEASKVEWDFQGHKETVDLKDNLLVLATDKYNLTQHSYILYVSFCGFPVSDC